MDLFVGAAVVVGVVCRAQKKAEREAMLRSQFEEKRAERVQKYQVRAQDSMALLLCSPNLGPHCS